MDKAEIHALIRKLNEIDARLGSSAASKAWPYEGAMAIAAAAYRECLNADTFRGRLCNLARAEKAMGSVRLLRGSSPMSPDHLCLENAGATVLSLIANGDDAYRKIERIG